MQRLTPRQRSASGSEADTASSRGERERRPRVQYTQDEEHWLVEGVVKYGTSWTTILRHYPFNRQRTAADIKEKYTRMMKVCKMFSDGFSFPPLLPFVPYVIAD